MSKEIDKTPHQDTNTKPRREVIGSGAAVAATMLFGLFSAACSDDDTDDMRKTGDAGRPASPDAGQGDAAATRSDADIEPLNALLSAEYSAITAYTAGAGLINDAPESDALYALRSTIVAIAVDIQSHHRLHAAALSEAIVELGGTAVTEAEVATTFVPPKGLTDNPTIRNVLKFAAGAERDAAVAYNKILAGLEDAQLRFLASAIEGDESQHFIVLAALVLGLAAPGPNLSADRTSDVVPEAFVTTVRNRPGLDVAPPDYFA